jgi:hypothetical protein
VKPLQQRRAASGRRPVPGEFVTGAAALPQLLQQRHAAELGGCSEDVLCVRVLAGRVTHKSVEQPGGSGSMGPHRAGSQQHSCTNVLRQKPAALEQQLQAAYAAVAACCLCDHLSSAVIWLKPRLVEHECQRRRLVLVAGHDLLSYVSA